MKNVSTITVNNAGQNIINVKPVATPLQLQQLAHDSYIAALNHQNTGGTDLKMIQQLQIGACVKMQYAYDFARHIHLADIDYCRSKMGSYWRDQFDYYLMAQALK